MEKITLEQLTASIAEAVAKALPNASPDEQLSAGREMFEKQRVGHVDLDMSEPGAKWTAFLACMAENPRDPSINSIAAASAALYGERHEFTATIGTSTATSGGVLVAPVISNDFLEILRPTSAILGIPGLRTMDMVAPIVLAGGDSGAIARFKGENATARATTVTFRDVKLTPHEAICIVPASNLSLQTIPAMGSIIQGDSRDAVAELIDEKFVYGTGANDTPIGIDTWCLDANKFDAQGSPTLLKVQSDVARANQVLDATNIPERNRAWIFSNRTKNYLRALRTGDAGDGAFAFRDDMRIGRFEDYPFRASNKILDNLGNGNNESTVYLIDAGHWIVGMNPQVRVNVFPGGAYVDSAGNMQSGIANNQTVFQIATWVDIAPRHAGAVVAIEDVLWKNS